MTPPAAPLAACPNCEQALGLPTPNFCPNCGQETRLHPPTLKELAQQFGGAYVSTEGALWRTLKLLMQPGELTRQYLDGRRKQFVQPLRLYLTISLVVLLLARALGGISVLPGLDNPALQQSVTSAQPSIRIWLFGPAVGLRDGIFYCDGLPDFFCAQARTTIESDPKALLDRLQRTNENLVRHWGEVMFLLLPAFTLAMALLYRNRRMRFTEHLVQALHLHSFWFIVLGLLLVLPGWALWPGVTVMVVYTLLAGRRVYGGRWRMRLLRGALLGLVYTAMLASAMVLTLLLAILW